jgi:3-phosphoglycerate kinase
MPAQIKYLSSSAERALKISAAIVGGYLVSASFHLMLCLLPNSREIIVSLSGITFFLVWGGLMTVAFLAHKGWKIWCLYLSLTLVFGAITWYFK